MTTPAGPRLRLAALRGGSEGPALREAEPSVASRLARAGRAVPRRMVAAARVPSPGVAMIEDAREMGDGWSVREVRHPLRGVVGVHAGFASEHHWEARETVRLSLVAGARIAHEAGAGRVVFLDTETTGLHGAGTLAWCVGLAWIERSSVVVEQLLLTDPSGEAEQLARLDQRLDDAGLLVTFNGRSFDLPLLESRRVLARRPRRARQADVDLLPPARRALASHAEQGARLAVLERAVGRRRIDDIAGADVPRAWFDWLQRGSVDDVRRAVAHNEDDLLAMVALHSWLLAAAAGDVAGEALVGSLSVAEMRLRRGDRAAAIAALEGEASCSGPEARRRARLVGRLRGRRFARSEWERLIDAGERSAEPWEALAKILEHDERDAAAALAIVDRALTAVWPGAGARRLEARRTRLAARAARGAALERPGRRADPLHLPGISL